LASSAILRPHSMDQARIYFDLALMTLSPSPRPGRTRTIVLRSNEGDGLLKNLRPVNDCIPNGVGKTAVQILHSASVSHSVLSSDRYIDVLAPKEVLERRNRVGASEAGSRRNSQRLANGLQNSSRLAFTTVAFVHGRLGVAAALVASGNSAAVVFDRRERWLPGNALLDPALGLQTPRIRTAHHHLAGVTAKSSLGTTSDAHRNTVYRESGQLSSVRAKGNSDT